MLQDLNRFEIAGCGVYFLFKGDKLIYIGQSEMIFVRLYAHQKTKDFDSYSFIKCENQFAANELEKQLIKKYNPALNKAHKQKSYDESMAMHLMSIKKLNEMREFYNLVTYKDKEGYTNYSIEEITH